MLFVVYGQQKSASTFLAHLTRHSCAAAGCNPDKVRARVLTGDLAGNRSFWNGDLFAVPEVADRLRPGEHMLIKTHVQYDPRYAEILARPDIHILISYRHPGDAALSAFEAGERARRNNENRPFFAGIRSHREAIDIMARLLDEATIPWIRSGLGTAFSYDRITRDTDSVLRCLGTKLNLPKARLDRHAGLQKLLSGETRVYNFNKGVAGRHRDAFSATDLAYLENRCASFIRFCEGEIGIGDI